MRKLMLAGTTLALAALALPAYAKQSAETPVTWNAPVPCSVTCPYWTDTGYDPDRSCAKEPLTLPMSWDDHRLTVPATVDGFVPRLLAVEIYPSYDFDGIVCRVLDPGSPEERYAYAAWMGCEVCGPCDLLYVLACSESALLMVKPGEVYVLRAYNWLDPTGTLEGSYSYWG